MCDENTILGLQETINRLQKKNCEYENLIEKLMTENMELIKKSARVDALNSQIDTILIATINNSDSTIANMQIEHDSNLESVIGKQSNQIFELSQQVEKLSQENAEKNAFIEQYQRKNIETMNLTRQLAEYKANYEYTKSLLENYEKDRENKNSENNNAEINGIKQINQNLIGKNSELQSQNIKLKNENQLLISKNAQYEMLLQINETEKKIINPQYDKKEIVAQAENIAKKSLNNINQKLSDLEKRISTLHNIVDSYKNDNDQSIIINELEERIAEFESDDLAPKLSSAYNRIKQLEAEMKLRRK